MRLTLLVIILILSNSFASDDQKMNACFVTINSSEEKHLFKEKLSTGANKGKFNFHELAPKGSDDSDWFKNACDKKIRCDILVVSGHFGGAFFGSSGLDLSMSELEKRSCKDDCNGIMSSPKEVFLLGCNTLAGKEEDNRSAAEYLDALLAHHIPVDQASRIAEQRYGSVGTSFKDSMKRAFKGVPHIYGFHSVGPSGKNIEPLLKKYHQKIPNYYDHLLKVEVERGLALMGEFTKWNQKNNYLAEALKITYFAQTSGVLIPCADLEGVDRSSPVYSILENICKLRSEQLTEDESLDLIRDLLTGEDFSLYLPVIADYIEGSNVKEKLSSLLQEYPQIKDNILNLLNDTKTGFGKLKVAKIALEMSILSEQDFKDLEKNAILSYLAPPVSVGSKDAICSYEVKEKISITMNDLDNRIFSDPYGLGALECLKIDDRKIVYKILNTAKNNKSAETREAAIVALLTSKITDPRVIQFLESKLVNGTTKDEQALALYVLADLNQGNDQIFNKIKSMLKSKRIIKLMSDSAPEYQIALQSLANVKLKDYEHLKEFFNIWKKQGRTDELGDYAFSSAISNLSESELLKFMNDKSLVSEQQKKKLLLPLQWEYGDPENKGTIKKMPLELYFYYLDEYLKGQNEDGIFYFKFANIKNEEDAAKLVSKFKKLRLDESKKSSLIQSMPQDVDSPIIMEYLVDEYQNNTSIAWSIGTYLKDKNNISKAEKEALKPLLGTEDFTLKLALEKHNVL